jgi:hypothetical protein
MYMLHSGTKYNMQILGRERQGGGVRGKGKPFNIAFI